MAKIEEVKAHVDYNEKILRDFIIHNSRVMSLISFIVGTIVVCIGALSIFFLSIVGGIVLCLFGVLILFYPKILEVTSLNANKKLFNAEDDYTFKKDSMHIYSIILGEERADLDLNYNDIYKVEQNSKYIYIYVSKVSALVLVRKELTIKEQDFILDRLKSKIKTKK